MAKASPSSISATLQHGDLGHPAHAVIGGLLAVDQAFLGHVLEQRLERDLLVPLQPERLGDLALAGDRVGGLEEFEDLPALGIPGWGRLGIACDMGRA